MLSLIETDTIKSIQQNIRLILTTPKGSDPLRPDFGSNVQGMLDQPLTSNLAAQFQAEIADCITAWEPRVEVREVNVRKVATEARIVVDMYIYVKELVDTYSISLWI